MKRLPFWRGIARILSHESLRQEVRSFGRWSLVAPFVMAILFACGQVALVRPTGMAAADTGSLIEADYQAWPSQAFAPLAEEIIPAIQRENGQLPEQVVIAGDYFPGLGVTPPPTTPIAMLAPPTSVPVSSSGPAPPTVTQPPPNPPSQNSPAPTATASRTVPPAPYPGPGKTATSTWRPAVTATRVPSRTPLPSPTRTLTRTPTRTPTQPQPLLTSTASLTPSLTPSPTHSPTHSATPTQATATLTRTPTQTVPPSSTTTATSTFTATPAPSRTATPTQTSLPSMTPTSTLLPTTPWMPPHTNTPTFTPSPTDTPRPTPTNTSTPTPMPTSTDTPTPTSTDTPTPTALPLPPDIGIGDPDGDVNDIQCGAGELVDLGAQTWIGTLILYEFYNPGGCGGGVCLDWIYVDLSDSADGPWTQYFYWGDTNGGNNGNVEAYHFPGGVEQDNEIIPPAELLNNSGILIGVGGNYRYVRLSAPNPCGDPAQVDSVDYWP